MLDSPRTSVTIISEACFSEAMSAMRRAISILSSFEFPPMVLDQDLLYHIKSLNVAG
jgi:hypothetical protein